MANGGEPCGQSPIRIYKSGTPAVSPNPFRFLRGHPCCFRDIVGQRREPLQNDADKSDRFCFGEGVVCSPEPPPRGVYQTSLWSVYLSGTPAVSPNPFPRIYGKQSIPFFISGGTLVVLGGLLGKGVSLCRTTLTNETFCTLERASFVPPHPLRGGCLAGSQVGMHLRD